MSDLPLTLEEMQAKILLSDLSSNPYFTESVIPSKNKGLNTNSKKIVGAINEILKRVIVCEKTMAGFTDEVDDRLKLFQGQLEQTLAESFQQQVNTKLAEIEESLQHKLEESYRKEIEQRLNAIEEKLSIANAQAISEQIDALKDQLSKGDEGMKRVLVEKVVLPKARVSTPSTAILTSITQEELFAENIVIYQDGYLLFDGVKTVQSSSSIYEVDFMPLSVRAIQEGIKLQNHNSNHELTVFIYKYA